MIKNDPHYQREKEKYENPVPSREYILEYLTNIAKPLSLNDLLDAFKLVDDAELTIGLQRRLRAMEREGQIEFNHDKCYTLATTVTVFTGKVVGHRDGFGFLEIEDQAEDWFIPAYEMKKLFHGDIVLAKSNKMSFKNKPEATIIKVVQSRSEPIVGRFFVEAGMAIVVPDDPRIRQDIMIQPGEELGARLNQVVSITLTQRATSRMNAMGKVIEVLGERLDPGMEIEIAIRNHSIPHIWPASVEAQIEKLTTEVPESAKKGRVDLRHLPLVTIDGEDARDFDDAVYCETVAGGGWRLWVAIADVSAYVVQNSPLDLEALNRGNSVYFPESVVPMLPEALSNGLCSLNPHVDRLTFVCEMTIDGGGRVSDYQFYEAVMNSACRFTYTQVAAVLAAEPNSVSKFSQFVPYLTNLHDLYKVLQATRSQRGAIEFETIETKFLFNRQRKIDRIVPLVRNDAHKLIEECMILANVSAAQALRKGQLNGLYRVHENPNPTKLSNFIAFLAERGIECRFSPEPTPHEVSTLLARLADRDDIELIQVMLLKSMKQAVYQAQLNNHFGLALAEYAHFTSPIRRYPDLVVHRVLKDALKNAQGVNGSDKAQPVDPDKEGGLYSALEADAIGLQCSMTERRADDATREVSDWLKCEFMQDHVGSDFDGIIAAVTNFGFFVRINDLHIDGLVHVTTLRNDYYHFDPARHVLIGEASRKAYRLGDTVSVRVAAVNLAERKIDLVLASMAMDSNASKAGKPGRSAKKSPGGRRKGADTAVEPPHRGGRRNSHDAKANGPKPKRRGALTNPERDGHSSVAASSPVQFSEPAVEPAISQVLDSHLEQNSQLKQEQSEQSLSIREQLARGLIGETKKSASTRQSSKKAGIPSNRHNEDRNAYNDYFAEREATGKSAKNTGKGNKKKVRLGKNARKRNKEQNQ